MGTLSDEWITQHPNFPSSLTGRKKGDSSDPAWSLDALHKKYTGALDQEEQAGLDAESYGYNKVKAFDPSAAFNTFAAGATDQAGKSLALQLQKLAGSSVGAGRLDTGFYDQDQGDVVRQVYGDLNNTLASKALDVTGMEQQQDQYLANYGTERRNRYLDLLSGGLDRRYAELHPPQAPSQPGFFSQLLSAGATLGSAAILA